ncbi:MAG: ribosomal protein L13e [Promethearchaeota archaeon]
MTETLRPFVRPPGNRVGERLGRGFSLVELDKADITVNEAKWMLIPIDRRRKTLNETNVRRLKEYLKRIKEILETEAEKKIEKAEPTPKPKPKPKKKKPKEVKKVKKIEKAKEEIKKPPKKPVKKPAKKPVKKPAKKPPKKKPTKEEPKIEDKISEKEIEAQAIEELTILKGLGTSIAKKLIDFGLLSLEDLVNMDMDIIAEETGISAERLKKWAKEAKGYLK